MIKADHVIHGEVNFTIGNKTEAAHLCSVLINSIEVESFEYIAKDITRDSDDCKIYVSLKDNDASIDIFSDWNAHTAMLWAKKTIGIFQLTHEKV